MREILFRGKIIDNGEWVQGSLFSEGSRLEIVRGTCNNIGIEGVSVIPKTVGQYTGLNDKNGTKIFEGDIIKEKDTIHNGEIQIKGEKFIIENASGCWWGIRKKSGFRRVIFLSHLYKYCEVIGNIYDNPELLKEMG